MKTPKGERQDMAGKRTEELLQKLGQRGKELAPQSLAERIKQRIPDRLMESRWGRERINIVIHLRISRVAAVAAIILSLVVFAGLFGRGQEDGGWYLGLKGMVRDVLSGSEGTEANLAKVYQELATNGVEAVYYGQNANSKDPTRILMHWKLPEGEYRVVFSNGRVILASPEQLIKLQSSMIHDMHQ
jgi:hypothetical protein